MNIQWLIINQDAILIRYDHNLCNHIVIDYTQAVGARKQSEVGIQLLNLAKAEVEEQIMYKFPGWSWASVHS